MNGSTEHRYAAASQMIFQRMSLTSNDITLHVEQQPLIARVAIGKEKDRKPIDPPPVVKLNISSRADPLQRNIYNPFMFMTCHLVPTTAHTLPAATLGNTLVGNLVSTLHKLKDDTKAKDNKASKEGSYFVFGDVSVKVEGWYKLQFSLFELRNHEQCSTYIASTLSEPFQVYSVKTWPGMYESTPLTRSFGDQGVKLRIRKEPRTLLKKRGPASDQYEPRRYRKSRQVNQEPDEEADTQFTTLEDDHRNLIDRHSSVDQSHFPAQDLPSHDYSPETNDYGTQNNFEHPPPSKRPRTSPMHSSPETFSQTSSITNSQTAGPNTYTVLQQSSLNYGQPTGHQTQGGFYDTSDLVNSLQTTDASGNSYTNRAQPTGFPSMYDSHPPRPPMMNQEQNNSRFARLQYGMSGQSAYTQNLGLRSRSGLIGEHLETYGYQDRQQIMDAPALMASTSTGRLNGAPYAGHGSMHLKMPFHPSLGQNQNTMAGGMTGGMFGYGEPPTTTSTTAPLSFNSPFS